LSSPRSQASCTVDRSSPLMPAWYRSALRPAVCRSGVCYRQCCSRLAHPSRRGTYVEIGGTALAVHLRKAVHDAALARVLGLDKVADLGQHIAALGQHLVPTAPRARPGSAERPKSTAAPAPKHPSTQRGTNRRLGRLKLEVRSSGRSSRSCTCTSTDPTITRLQSCAPHPLPPHYGAARTFNLAGGGGGKGHER
jgi:hypothetical protein